MAFYDRWIQQFRRIVSLSPEEATRGQRAVQFSIRLTRHCGEQLLRDNATQLAAALTYRTIFGLVPFFVVALIIVRAFGGFEHLGEQLESRLFDYFGISRITVAEQAPPPPATDGAPGAPATAPAGQPEEDSSAANIRQVIRDMESRISDLNFASIGVVGVLLLIWAAIGLVVTVEDAFNQVYRAVRGRAWTTRIPVYWAVITLGPLLVGLSLWLTGQVAGWIDQLSLYMPAYFAWALNGFSRLAALVATWGLLVLMFVWLPNTSVKLRPALVGAFVAAVLWEIAKWGFQLYVQNAVGVTALYGTLALIPLFLLWLYLTWLIILFGLELTYALQTMPADGEGEFEPKPEPSELLDPRWMISLMVAIGEGFEDGEARSINAVAERLGLTAAQVARLSDRLAQEGLVHRVDGSVADAVARYTLARPPRRIALSRVLAVGQAMGMDEQAAQRAPAHDLLEELGEAQSKAINNKTLADVVDSNDETRRGS